MKCGYARVSTTDQDLTLQTEALNAAGCEVIRSEKVTGTTRQGRSELATLLEFIREGDTLAVTRFDRLERKHWRSPGHRTGAQGEGRAAAGDRAADRYRHRGRKSFPRHAWGLRRIRDQPAEGAAAGGDRQGEGRRHPQGAEVDYRPRGGAEAKGGRRRPERDPSAWVSVGQACTGLWRRRKPEADDASGPA